MMLYKIFTIIFACCTVFATKCLGLIFSVSRHSRTDNIPTVLEHWGDKHNQGTKQENLVQLKMFINDYLLTEPVHLIIESPFFYGLDYKNTNISKYLEDLGKVYDSGIFPWSFYNSPQDPAQTTWIAWELPIILFSVFSNEVLPEGFELNQQQRELILNNVTAEFHDPRLHSSDEEVISGQVKFNFKEANKSSPEKTANILATYVESRFSNATINTSVSTYLAHAFDVEALSSIINSIYSANPAKKIVVLSGQYHQLQLDKIVPQLGFSNLRQFQLNYNQNNNNHFNNNQVNDNKVRRKLEF